MFRPLRISILAVIGVAISVAAACRAESESDKLKRRLEQRAAEEPTRATVSVGAIHHRKQPDAGSRTPPYRVPLESGGSLEIREAYIVIAAVELHACESGRDDYETPDGPLLNSLDELFVPTARAHVASSSNRFGTPFLEKLTGLFDRARILGEIAPPLAAYCRVAAVVAPADSDIVHSTELSTDEIVGSSVLVRGRRRESPEADWTAFEWTTDAAEVFEFPARNPRSGETPLMLDSPDDELMLLIDKTVGPEVFAVDPDGKDPASEVLKKVGASMRVHVY